MTTGTGDGANGTAKEAAEAERPAVLVANVWSEEIAASPALEASTFGPSGGRFGERSSGPSGGQAGSLSSGPSGAGVRVGLPGVVGLLVVRAEPTLDGLGTAFAEVFGLDLPGRLGSTASGTRCARWLGPDEWLLSCPPAESFELERRFRAALDGAAVTDVTGGYAVLELAGPDARTVLAKSTPLDVDPRAFAPGRVAGTVFAKTTLTLRHVEDGCYELICRRSFADYVARWIARASAEHGLAVTEARG